MQMDNATLSACQPSAGVQLLAPLLPRFTFNGKFVYFLNWPHPAPQLSRISASQDGEHEMFFPRKEEDGNESLAFLRHWPAPKFFREIYCDGGKSWRRLGMRCCCYCSVIIMTGLLTLRGAFFRCTVSCNINRLCRNVVFVAKRTAKWRTVAFPKRKRKQNKNAQTTAGHWTQLLLSAPRNREKGK